MMNNPTNNPIQLDFSQQTPPQDNQMNGMPSLDMSNLSEQMENQEDSYDEMTKNLPPIPETVSGEDADESFFKKYKKLEKYIKTINIAEDIDDQKLIEIGKDIVESTQYDDSSREEWLENLKDALKVTKLTKEIKNYPWPKAANVKYPICLKGCIEYNSRMLPEIIQGDQVVNFDVMKDNVTEDDENLARRLASHMSYQRLKMSKHWRKELDRLLMILPLVGTAFKKSYWDNFTQIPDSDICMPDDIIINNNVQSIEKAERITHRIYLTENEVIEKINSGIFIEHDLDTIRSSQKDDPTKTTVSPNKEFSSFNDESSFENKMWVFYEQHGYLDLDDDGYREPYIVTVHIESQTVFRIVARYDYESLCFNKESKKLIGINAINYFTDFHFIPSPDGDYYSLGFANILYPLNDAINTIINQLLNAGHLANLGGGLLGKSLRMKKGAFRMRPGMWEQVDSAGGDLAQNVFPLPVKEPSPTLFQLLGLLIQSSEDLISMTDVMQGQGTPGNMAATTSNNLVEQGMKVYTAILTRFNEAQGREYEKLYELNRKYLTESQYFKTSVSSGMIQPSDYMVEDFGIFPIADPDMSTESRRLARAQLLIGLPNVIPNMDPYEVGHQFLTTLRFPNTDKLLPKPLPVDPNAPPPLPDQLTMAQIENLKMQTADMLMKRELEGLDADVKERRLALEQQQIAAEIEGGQVNNMVQIAELEEQSNQQQIQNAIQIADRINDQTIQQMSQPFPGTEDLVNRIQGLESAIGQEIGLPQDVQGNQSQNSQPSSQTGIANGQTGQQAAFPKITPPLLNEFTDQIDQELKAKNEEPSDETSINNAKTNASEETKETSPIIQGTTTKNNKTKSLKVPSTSLKPPLPKLPTHVPEALPINEAE